ncbi:root hair specific 4 [Euphorbia peplus]|nr:root hair specific 4 [Euphorbia peplus]
MAESNSTPHNHVQVKERQILVDPQSLRESSSRREPSFNLMLPPVVSPPDGPPPLRPPHVNYSLPNSPKFRLSLLKKKSKHESQASPRQIDRLGYGHSVVAEELNDESSLRRSKSCAVGRSSVDELDFHFNKPNNHVQYRTTLSKSNNHEEEFKCSALCIYLPGFGKVKAVRSKKGRVVEEEDVGAVISRTVSLEKFECGSWASSAIMNDYEGDNNGGLYFDLPMELIQNSGNDADSPVSAAFIFDKERKGVLKNQKNDGSRRISEGRKSAACESTRHVRFSTSSSPSSPSCITPRLRKAREEFNAFLEAQTA